MVLRFWQQSVDDVKNRLLFHVQKMKINCFCGMVEQRKAFSLISSRDHCQRSSSSRISDTPWAGFEPTQNLSSGLVEGNCAVVITTTPRRHKKCSLFFIQKMRLHKTNCHHLNKYLLRTARPEKMIPSHIILVG